MSLAHNLEQICWTTCGDFQVLYLSLNLNVSLLIAEYPYVQYVRNSSKAGKQCHFAGCSACLLHFVFKNQLTKSYHAF